jgi:hypothetical protein
VNRVRTTVPALALAALLFGAIGTVSAAAPGYAAYSVQVSCSGTSHSFTVNESVSATSNANYDRLTLAVVSGNSTFSYSTSINSSLDVSPFIPFISNQSFSYTYNSTTVALSIINNGTTPVKFHGATYSLTSYAAKVTISSYGTNETINAELWTFPSGLIYSVKASIPTSGLGGLGNLTMPSWGVGLGSLGPGSSPFDPFATTASGTATLSVTLLSTSLPLSGSAPSMTEQAASIGIGAGAVAVVLALGLNVRKRHERKSDAAPKPEYAVD